MRYNLYRCVQINGSAAPGYSSGQAMKALEEVFAQTMPAEMGYDYLGMSFQEKKASEGVLAERHLWNVVVVRIPDSRGAIRKLVIALQRAAGNAGRGFRRALVSLDARTGKQRVRANRSGDADRTGREKCDFDRRIRKNGV